MVFVIFLGTNERRVNMKRAFYFSILLSVAFIVFNTSALQAKENAIVLKGITAFPMNHLANDPVPIFIDKINKRANGRLKIEWIGGPEVIKSFDQAHALKAGTVDLILYYPFAYMKSLVPVAEAKALSELTPWEERKSGAFDLLSKILAEKANVKFLGSLHGYVGYSIYSKKKIEKLEDFQGMKIRAQPLYVPLIKALGATPTSMPAPDIYTAMERGVVDGFIWPRVGMISWGLQEVAKYVVEPSFFRMGQATMMNLDKWNAIPADLQEMMMDEMQDMEYIGIMRNIMLQEYEDNVRKSAGMEYVQLSPADAEKFKKLAYEKTWELVIKMAPQDGPELKRLFSKKALQKDAFPWLE
jgi:TRAP-type C4-dicarboxylate transport system substrate-binding protein